MVRRHIEIDVPCTFWFSFISFDFLFLFSVLLTSSLALYTPYTRDRYYLKSNTKGFFFARILIEIFTCVRICSWYTWCDTLRTYCVCEEGKKITNFFNILWIFPVSECLAILIFPFWCLFSNFSFTTYFWFKHRMELMVVPWTRGGRHREMERSIFQRKWIEITKFGYFIYTQTNKLNWVWDIEFMANGMRQKCSWKEKPKTNVMAITWNRTTTKNEYTNQINKRTNEWRNFIWNVRRENGHSISVSTWFFPLHHMNFHDPNRTQRSWKK